MTIRIRHPQTAPREATADNEFINPYNFVTTPARPDFGELGDRTPDGHDRLLPERYTGSIPITLTTRTPLLLPDQANSEPPVPRRTPRRAGTRTRGTEQHSPALLTGSTVKGVLRAAFETITNSRFGVISSKHELPVAIRQNASEVQERAFMPAVVTECTMDGRILATAGRRLYHSDQPDDEPHPAPWIPKTHGTSLAKALGLTDPIDLDSQMVDAWIHLQWHPPGTKQAAFPLWRVSVIGPPDSPETRRAGTPPNSEWSEKLPPVKVRGQLHWTHSTFPAGGAKPGSKSKEKHDERLIVTEVLSGPAKLKRSPDLDISDHAAGFDGIIDSYVSAHSGEADLRRRFGSYVWDRKRWKLAVGRTLYIEFVGRSRNVIGVFPAIIGREPFAIPPVNMIDELHRSAADYTLLSPAENVFGWVHGNGRKGQSRTAYRGKLRVDPPSVIANEPSVHDLGGARWLGTLNGPKTEQYRFYTGGSEQNPLVDGEVRSTKAGYRADKDATLRGRKVYLPHPDTHNDAEYWEPDGPTLEPRNGRRRDREYLSPTTTKPDVKFAVKSWVPVGVTFTTTLWVENMTKTEIGALLWLFALPDAAVYGIGLGKPLGFGSVRIDADWNAIALFTEGGMKARYRSLRTDASQGLSSSDLEKLVTGYDATMSTGGLGRVRDQFLDAAMGFVGAPVHYPRPADRKGNPSPPQEKLYEWFVANEKPGRFKSLPALGDGSAPTLPYWPS